MARLSAALVADRPAGAPYGALRTQWLAGASGSPVLVDRTLSYDRGPACGCGNVIQVADRVANETLDDGYDHRNRLTQVAGGFNESYQHDQIGNLTGIGGVVQHYPGAGEPGPRHAPIWIGSTADSLAYDANGNLIARGTKPLQYDPRNRLMRVAVDGATVARHTYDGEGVRTKRLDANGTIHYVGRRYERNVGNGGSLPDVGTTYIEAQLGPRTVLLAFRKGGQLTVVGTDHLGGTLATAAGTGGLPITGRLRYTPYGQGLGASGNFGTDRGFTGQTVDAMAGLYWFASRSYDPSIGRFVQPDTVVPDWTNPQALNRYAYALNNPLRYVDPSGHDPWASDPDFITTPADEPITGDADRGYTASGVAPIRSSEGGDGAGDGGMPPLSDVFDLESIREQVSLTDFSHGLTVGAGVGASGGVGAGAMVSLDITVDSRGGIAEQATAGAGGHAGAGAAVGGHVTLTNAAGQDDLQGPGAVVGVSIGIGYVLTADLILMPEGIVGVSVGGGVGGFAPVPVPIEFHGYVTETANFWSSSKLPQIR